MKIRYLIIMLLLIPIVSAIEECQDISEPQDIPCKVTSLWNYTPPCNGYNVTVYNNTGHNIINYSMDDYGTSSLCNFTWNISEKGSYSYLVSNGDSGSIIIKVTDMLIGLTIGIGILCAIFLWLSFVLDESHYIMKIFLIFMTIITASIIPATFIISDPAIILHKLISRFVVFFWIYVGVYFVYRVLLWMGVLVPGGNNNE